MSEWISIKDKLPEKGQLIVYCSKTPHISSVGIFWNDPHDPLGPIPSCPNWLNWDNVTHWMNLPEVPTQEK